MYGWKIGVAETAPKHDFHGFYHFVYFARYTLCYLHFNCEFAANIHTCFWCVIFEVRGTCKMLKKHGKSGFELQKNWIFKIFEKSSW